MKPKILIFNGYYYPSKNSGGPITSIENTVNSLSEEFDFYIIAYNHDFNDNKPFDVPVSQWISVGKAKVMYVKNNDLDFSIKENRRMLETLKPSLVWFSGVLTPNNKIVSLINGRKLNIPILFSPRGEVSADRVAIKKIKKVTYLRLVNLLRMFNNAYFHATSSDEVNGIKQFFKPKSSHLFFSPNISIQRQERIINRTKKIDELKIVFFSRIHHVKNLHYAIKAVNNCKKTISFDIYGPIESKEYWEECLKLIKESPENIKITYKGIIERDSMSRVLQDYHYLLFPTINENYGHVIAESLANSLPVIISQGTTPWDDVNNIAGYSINLDYPNMFSETLDKLASLDDISYQKVVEETENYFTKKMNEDEAVDSHRKMFLKIINGDII
ncbi:glycosyltransferase family 4 protein [Streptococcus zalophi]|uniref:Glycosyltransferase n=1 Tax=Streptococcus zalophi TaxID=640031 RepID=A0A934UD57_9STRE|nr:glycosyltransferase [Streptococcus zalophi]MBJ8349334.1 glycosyltransferase [Streptococcus zalophi]